MADDKVRISKVTFQPTESKSVIKQVTIHPSNGNSLEKRITKDEMEAIETAVVALDRGLGFVLSDETAKDCIEITTENGTTIRINCPIITAGEPTVE